VNISLLIQMFSIYLNILVLFTFRSAMIIKKPIRYALNILLTFVIIFSFLPIQAVNAYGPTTIYVRFEGNDLLCDGSANVDYDGGIAPACAFATIPAAIAAASSGNIIYVSGGYSFSEPIVIDKSIQITLEDLTWLVNSTAGSRVFDVKANGVRISGEGLEGGRLFSYGSNILVDSGVSDLIIDGLTLSVMTSPPTQAAIVFSGAITNLQIVNNDFSYWESNTNISFASNPTGNVTIRGNYFDSDIQTPIPFPEDASGIDVSYNSWGSIDGPSANIISALNGANYLPFTYAKLQLTGDNIFFHEVVVGDSVTINVSIDANRLIGADFILNFPPAMLQFVSSSLEGSAFSPDSVVDVNDAGSGSIHFHGLTMDNAPLLAATEALVCKITFLVIGSGDPMQNGDADISFNRDTDTFTSDAPDGPSNNITGSSQSMLLRVREPATPTITGTISMQGQINRGGVITELWQSGELKYSTSSIDQITNNASMSVLEGLYDLIFEKAGYLDMTLDLGKSATFTTMATTLNSIELKGGDANDDNVIDISDASIIGADYGTVGRDEPGYFSDINSSGSVDIFDLALMAGNFDLTSAIAYGSWTPQ
jgi:hypothetical protein